MTPALEHAVHVLRWRARQAAPVFCLGCGTPTPDRRVWCDEHRPAPVEPPPPTPDAARDALRATIRARWLDAVEHDRPLGAAGLGVQLGVSVWTVRRAVVGLPIPPHPRRRAAPLTIEERRANANAWYAKHRGRVAVERAAKRAAKASTTTGDVV